MGPSIPKLGVSPEISSVDQLPTEDASSVLSIGLRFYRRELASPHSIPYQPENDAVSAIEGAIRQSNTVGEVLARIGSAADQQVAFTKGLVLTLYNTGARERARLEAADASGEI